MSTGPEIYPPEALADDEPRYLRRQKPLEVRRRKFGQKSWPAYRKWTLVAATMLAAGVVTYRGIRFLLVSSTVEFAGSYQIEITGNQFVGRSAITDIFSPDLGRSILRVPLDARRNAIEAIPWVESATVERTLPDRIRIEIVERTPVAFLRSGNELQLVDASGVLLERPLEAKFHFPVVSGFDETTPGGDRKARMALFVDFMKEIDLAHPGAGEQVSEVDLSDPQDVRAMLAGLPGLEGQYPIWVHFGNVDFVNKYHLLAENIAQWRASAGRVESVDLRFARQVVVNPERDPAPAKPVEAAVHSPAPAAAHRSPSRRSN
jgi:cell division protein FtsQ